ncbi:MAG TPA: hypothetical protein VHB98_22410, partial [Chloroflexota bacterium]|nr:hypothetical protein [Chloroflexota bacterium]
MGQAIRSLDGHQIWRLIRARTPEIPMERSRITPRLEARIQTGQIFVVNSIRVDVYGHHLSYTNHA